MNEVEKMYSLAGVKKKVMCEWTCSKSEVCNTLCEHYESTNEYYPPFTAEKQILLIQWLLDKTDLYLHRHKTDFTYSIASGNFSANKNKVFKESIAEFINDLWQDLTDAEKAEIKNILESEVRE